MAPPTFGGRPLGKAVIGSDAHLENTRVESIELDSGKHWLCDATLLS
jgi:hypothetical protein